MLQLIIGFVAGGIVMLLAFCLVSNNFEKEWREEEYEKDREVLPE